jgi:hypothetical protein
LIAALTPSNQTSWTYYISSLHRAALGAKDVVRLQAKDSVIKFFAMHTGATRAVRRTTESLRGTNRCGAFD